MATIAHADYEAVQPNMSSPAKFGNYTQDNNDQIWQEVLRPLVLGSAGVIVLGACYDSFLHYFRSSSFVDSRPSTTRRASVVALPEPAPRCFEILTLSVVDQMKELLASLSLNKSLLAQILRVTRPTVYEWFQGKEPNPANNERLLLLLSLLTRASITGANPLNARFVRRPIDLNEPPIVDLLSAETLDQERIVCALEKSRMLGDAASGKRADRENRLRTAGFQELSTEERRENLAINVALMDWPYR